MKTIFYIFLLVFITIFITIIGIPSKYHGEYYVSLDDPYEVNELEMWTRINEEVLSRTRSFIAVTGAPYEISFNAYGDKNIHESLIIESLVIADSSGNDYTLISKDNSIELDFIGGTPAEWDPSVQLSYRIKSPQGIKFSPKPPHLDGDIVTVHVKVIAITKSGQRIRYGFNQKYKKRIKSGYRLFPLIRLTV